MGSDANVVVVWRIASRCGPTSPVVLKRIIYVFFMTNAAPNCAAANIKACSSRGSGKVCVGKSMMGKVLSRLAEREFSSIEESRLANAVAMAMNAENPFSAYAYVQSEAFKAAAARIYAL